jgi:hypothetical protein
MNDEQPESDPTSPPPPEPEEGASEDGSPFEEPQMDWGQKGMDPGEKAAR